MRGRDAEGHLGGAGRASLAEARSAQFANFQQRLQAGIHHAAQALQSQRHHRPVLAQQRHRVGDGRNGHDFQERRHQPRPSGALQQRLRQLEGHARAAQKFAGIPATGLVGIEHGQRPRNAFRLRHQMMIGDDQVHARALGGFGGGKGADAGVHADDEP